MDKDGGGKSAPEPERDKGVEEAGERRKRLIYTAGNHLVTQYRLDKIRIVWYIYKYIFVVKSTTTRRNNRREKRDNADRVQKASR